MGQINAWGQTVEFAEKKINAEMIEMPDGVEDIIEIASKDANVRNNSFMVTDYGKGIEFTKSEINDKSIQVNGTSLLSKGYIVANEDISFNINSFMNTGNKGIVVCSANGNISIQASSVDMQGIIYAPEGTVYINANSFKLLGRIIAKRIVVNCSNFEVRSTENDLKLVDVYIGD